MISGQLAGVILHYSLAQNIQYYYRIFLTIVLQGARSLVDSPPTQ